MSGLFLFGGLLSGTILLVPVILVLALLVILALRHDDDADASRAPAIYGALIAFVGLLTLLFAATGVTSSIASLTADQTRGAIGVTSDDSFTVGGGGSVQGRFGERMQDDDDDAAITSAVGFLIAGAAALGLLAVHRPLFARRRDVTGAGQRVHRAYLLVLCLVTAVVATVAAGAGAYALYRAVFPDTAGSSNRADDLRTLVTLIVLFVGAGGLWRWHWRQLDLGGPAEVSAPAAP